MRRTAVDKKKSREPGSADFLFFCLKYFLYFTFWFSILFNVLKYFFVIAKFVVSITKKKKKDKNFFAIFFFFGVGGGCKFLKIN